MVIHTSTLLVAALLVLGLFGFAFVAAPHSCEWGLQAYVLTGAAVLALLIALPWLLEAQATFGRRALFSLGFAGLGLAVWIAGLFAANVRLICRLF